MLPLFVSVAVFRSPSAMFEINRVSKSRKSNENRVSNLRRSHKTLRKSQPKSVKREYTRSFNLPIYALLKLEIELTTLKTSAQFSSGYIWVLSGYRIQKRISQLQGRYFCLAHLASRSGHVVLLTTFWFCRFVDLVLKMIRFLFSPFLGGGWVGGYVDL